jgi:hypothetical protein
MGLTVARANHPSRRPRFPRRGNIAELLNRVLRREARGVVEKNGIPVAAIS